MMTEAEREVLALRGLDATAGLRLSCQIQCDHDMSVRIVSRLSESTFADAGNRPKDSIEPPPVWAKKQ